MANAYCGFADRASLADQRMSVALNVLAGGFSAQKAEIAGPGTGG